MSDNVVANPGVGGAQFRAFSDGTNEWPASVTTYVSGGSAGAWTLQYVDATHGLPANIINTSIAVTAASLPLPSGASTAAKQPSLGTAGTAASDVLTVQGVASMTPILATLSGTNTLTGITNVVHVDDNSSTLSIDDGSGSITVDGTITASLSASTNAGATVKTADYDSGAGTDTVTMFGVALPASGGAVAGGTSTNPFTVAGAIKILDSGSQSFVSVSALFNSTGNGVLASGIVGCFDDVAPTAITENQLGVVRMSSNRNVYTTLRDAAGNERGANIDSSNRLSVSVDNVANVVHVDDNSGSITVDGTVAATQSGTWTVQPGNTANTTAWKVDASSVAVPVTDNSGSLTVDNAGTFATQAAQSGTWTVQPGNTANTTAWKVDGSAVTQPVSGTVTANQGGAPWSENVTQLGGASIAVNNGTASTGTARVTIASDSTGNIATIGTSVVPGTSATHLGKAEDAAHTSGDTGVMALAVRESSPTDLSAGNTNGDYEPLQVGKNGGLWVSQSAEAQGGCSVATGTIGATKTDIGTANTAGSVYGWYFYNANASVAYVQFFNTQASGVTLGTTAPVYSLGIPATSGANVICALPIAHSTAISIAITTTRSGSTGPGSTVDYNIFYKQ